MYTRVRERIKRFLAIGVVAAVIGIVAAILQKIPYGILLGHMGAALVLYDAGNCGEGRDDPICNSLGQFYTVGEFAHESFLDNLYQNMDFTTEDPTEGPLNCAASAI